MAGAALSYISISLDTIVYLPVTAVFLLIKGPSFCVALRIRIVF